MCEKLMQAAKQAVRDANSTGQAHGVVGNHINGYQVVTVPTEHGKALPRVVVHPASSGDATTEQVDALCDAAVSTRESVRLAYLIGYHSALASMRPLADDIQAAHHD